MFFLCFMLRFKLYYLVVVPGCSSVGYGYIVKVPARVGVFDSL